jgi:hypothetical protein
MVTSLLYLTLRVKIRGEKALVDASRGSLIIALWHDSLILAPLIRKVIPDTTISLVVSNSRDGRLLAAYANTYKNVESIFVAHNMRHTALLQSVDAIKNKKPILITPDGPRGPRHELKRGIFFAQEKSGATIIAMSWSCSSFWELNSWDKLRIPKPFSKVTLTFTAATESDLEQKLQN